MDVTVLFRGILLLIVLSCCHSQLSLKASVNMAGIYGDVIFNQTALDQTTMFYFNLAGASGVITWEFRETWVDYTVEDSCADDVIGPRYDSRLGGQNAAVSQGSIPLSVLPNVKMLLGRSILVTSGGNKACGTLMKPLADYETAFVRLQGKITGEIWFRQSEGEITEILADVFDASAATSASYGWGIYTGSSTNCTAVSAIFNPTTPGAGACGTNNQMACPIGDLRGKHGDLAVGQTKGSSRKFMHDSNLSLSGPNTVTGKYLVIMDGANNIISCGMIRTLKGKQAQAILNKDGVAGSLKFMQDSPFDVTSVYVNLVGLHSAAAGYHVHEYPVPVLVEFKDELCSLSSVGGHWNPYNKPFPTTGATTDIFEVGDLSGKFGSLQGKESLFENYQDYNLPLFGPESIVGRSLVIHKSLPGAPRWVCANINDLEARTVAIATFKSSVIGTVIFSQTADDPDSDTWIYGELNYGYGSLTPTTQHMWAVQENMVPYGVSRSGDACPMGETYNPFNTNTAGDYATQCKPLNPLRCQVGDGTKLAGNLSIRADDTSAKKFFFTTSNMPLSGYGSIIGKSLVIYSANSGQTKLSCTNIYHLRTREAIVDMWTTSVKGYFKFSQKYSHVNDPTHVSINVSGMNSLAGPYHIHVLPVPPNSQSPCSGESVAGHYNPYYINPSLSPAPTKGTYDKYEAGDLSGKYGKFDNKSSFDGRYADDMVNLFGLRSIVGRSVVIHKMSDGARWSCGNIREDVAMTGGTMHRAKADFMNSDVTGHAVLTQYMYPDGAMSDTSVYVYIKYANNRAETKGHTIRVGMQPAWGDRTSTSNRCTSTGSTFNPFRVNTQSGYGECGMENPLRCTVGDISGKIGTYNVSGAKMFSTDVNLPIYGIHSVIGRSLVIGAANGGAGSIACANIKPETAEYSMVTVDSAGNALHDISNKYAEALDTHPWNVAVFGNDKDSACGAFKVYFMGKDARDLKNRFNQLTSRNDNSLGNFKPTVCGADKIQMSALLIAVVFFLRKVLL